MTKDWEMNEGMIKKYDAICKNILSQKIILAWIMKECMVEFEGYSVDEISKSYIENELRDGDVPMEKDGEEWMPRIQGNNVEDTSSTEGKITYDIRFIATTPVSGRHIWVDVEPQKNFRPGYSLLKRGTYYLARMISAQKGREFTGMDYNNLKKAYTVWICLNPPQKWEHTIHFYEIQDRNGLIEPLFHKDDFDLMTQVVICLGDPRNPRAVGVRRLLSVLLTNVYDFDEKQRILETEFSITVTDMIRKEMDSMCDLGLGIYEDGIEKGIGIFNQLILTLLSDGRYEELEKVVRDTTYRDLLMNEYGLLVKN